MCFSSQEREIETAFQLKMTSFLLHLLPFEPPYRYCLIPFPLLLLMVNREMVDTVHNFLRPGHCARIFPFLISQQCRLVIRSTLSGLMIVPNYQFTAGHFCWAALYKKKKKLEQLRCADYPPSPLFTINSTRQVWQVDRPKLYCDG